MCQQSGGSKSCGGIFAIFAAGLFVATDALAHAMDVLEKTPEAMVAGAWLLMQMVVSKLQRLLFLLAPTTGLKHLLRFGYGYRAASFVPSSAFEVSAVSGVFMCINRASFKVLGGFDEDYFLSIEDLDLCRRCEMRVSRCLCCRKYRWCICMNIQRHPLCALCFGTRQRV